MSKKFNKAEEKFKVAQMYKDDATADEVVKFIIENRAKNYELSKAMRKAGLSKGSLKQARDGGGMHLYTAQEFLAACGYRLKVEVVE